MLNQDALEGILLKLLKSKAAVAEFLGAHPDLSTEGLLAAAEASSRSRQLVQRKVKELHDKQGLDELRSKVQSQSWDELLITARAMVLAGLPYKKTKERQLVREARLGNGQVLKVFYNANGDHPLPYGKDRALLAWVTTCASRQGHPRVHFDSALEFMRAFDLGEGGAQYRFLRECLDRLKSFSCYITISNQVQERTGQEAVVRYANLPTRQDAVRESAGEQMLPAIHDGFYIELDSSFFAEVQQHGVPIPLELMKRYTNSPLAWDFISWINYRTKIARSPSRIPLQTLASMLGASNTSNIRKLKADLEKVLRELREIWPECPVRFEGRGEKSLLYVAPPTNGTFLVAERDARPSLSTAADGQGTPPAPSGPGAPHSDTPFSTE